MTGYAHPPPGFLDADGAIVIDHGCAQCEYNLRGRRQDERCPECGMPVALSTTASLLRFADPGWLRVVTWGLTIVVLSLAIRGVLLVLAYAPLNLGPRAVGPLSFAAVLGFVIGVWLLTAREPGGVRATKSHNLRWIIRGFLLASVLGVVIRALPIGGGRAWAIAMFLFQSIVLILVVFAKMAYCAQLARRLPDDKLASWIGGLMWALCAALALMAGLALHASGLLGFTTSGVGSPIESLGHVIRPAVIIVGAMMLVVLVRLRGRVAEQTAGARRLRNTLAETMSPS